MSFWDNNKDSFKSAGKSTFKGITSGTKAVGQAGYRTYKKNEAKRKGVEYHDPIKNESKSGETNVPYNPSPLPSKDKLSSYQPPPKRNVGTFGVPQREKLLTILLLRLLRVKVHILQINNNINIRMKFKPAVAIKNHLRSIW